MNTIFSQQISYDRSKAKNGHYYVGKKPVKRFILAVHSTQESSVMVQQGKAYVCFITANTAFYGDDFPQSYFFATPEEAIAFCEKQVALHA